MLNFHRLRQFFGLLIAVSVVGAPVDAVADVNYVYFTAQPVKWGSAEQLVVLPRTFQSSADMTTSGIAAEAFHKLKSYRGAVFSDASLTLDRDFSSTGAASVLVGKAAQRDLHIVVSEIYWTLKANGVREVRFPEIKKGALRDSEVPLGNAVMVMQLWQVLPPARPGRGFVLVDGELMSARKARKKVEARALAGAVHALLESPLAFVRLRVVKALQRLQWTASEAALLPLLQDRNKEVKMAVMSGFKGTKSTRVLRFLEKVVKNDPDPSVKSAAVRILNKAGIKKFAVFALFEKLGSSDDGVVMDAISKLAKEDKPEVAMALIDVMPHRNAQVRKMAMSTIVALNNIEALLKIMGSDRIEMNFRNEAAGILAKGDDDNGNTALAHLMDNGNTELVINTTVTVAKRRRYRLVGRVITNLGHADSGIRAASSKALATIKDSKALTPLAAAVRADRENSKLHEKAVLAILGDLSREEVIKRSGDKDTLIRQLAIKTLFKFTEAGRPHPSVLRVLKQRLGDSDKDIRRSAAFALARIKDAGVVRSLVKLIADPDGAIRAQVAVALSASKHPRADTLLMQLMADSNPPTKRAAIDGLRQRGFKAVLQKLRFLANHRTPEVRRAVMQAIFELAGPEGWDKWFDIWQGALFDLDPQVKIWAAKGISQRRDPRVPGLLDALVMDRNGAVQIAALEGLGKSGQPSAIEYIAKGLMDIKRDVKIAALDALKSLNLEGGKIPIREFVKNEADKVLVSKANDIYDALP